MTHKYVAFLRNISNVPMAPFRLALEELGLKNVESIGGTGNLLFSAERKQPADLEAMIDEKLGTNAFVRRRADLARIVAENPFAGRPNSAVLFLARPVSTSRRRAFEALKFDSAPPVLNGRVVYVVHPTLERGKRSPMDFERVLEVPATARASKVVKNIAERMSR